MMRNSNLAVLAKSVANIATQQIFQLQNQIGLLNCLVILKKISILPEQLNEKYCVFLTKGLAANNSIY